MSDDDVAAKRAEQLLAWEGTPKYIATWFAEARAMARAYLALNARLQEAERERDDWEARSDVVVETMERYKARAEAAEAREKTLREALELVKRLRNLGFTGLVASYWNEEADRVIARALAADEEQS